jgi:hypothetical protein
MVRRHVPTLNGNGREDKEQRRGSPDAARDSGNGVRSRPGLEKRCTLSLKKKAAFGVRRLGEKKPIELDLKIKSKNERKVKKSGCELPKQRERESKIRREA